MAEATLPHDMPAVYEPSLFGTYSKKIGMWLFLLSDSLTFGALLYAYSYGRISTPQLAHAVPFRKHRERHHHDGVPADQFADHGSGRTRRGKRRRQGAAPVAAGHHGLRHGFRHSPRARMEQSDCRGPDSAGVSKAAGPGGGGRVCQCCQDRAAISRHLFWPHRNAHAARDPRA